MNENDTSKELATLKRQADTNLDLLLDVGIKVNLLLEILAATADRLSISPFDPPSDWLHHFRHNRTIRRLEREAEEHPETAPEVLRMIKRLREGFGRL